MMAAAVAAIMLIDPGSKAQSLTDVPGPLISRGYTRAPAGTVVIASNPNGGEVLVDLRIVEGQKVRRDEVVAVLSNFATADFGVRQAEGWLKKTGQQREAMVSGYRVAAIAMQEAVVRSAEDEARLKAFELQRSSLPADQKQLQATLSRQAVEREQAKLRIQKEALATDLAQIDAEMRILQARLDDAKMTREETLVRAPVDGVVVDIFTRQGERVSFKGIARIVDLAQIRIFADVDEIHLARMQPGSRAEFTFRGSSTMHSGTVVRTPLLVKRTKQSEADFGESSSRLAEVEVKPDNLSDFPLMLGREARVVFP